MFVFTAEAGSKSAESLNLLAGRAATEAELALKRVWTLLPEAET